MTNNARAPRNVIFNADCIEVMRSFDRGSVDMIVTDPPYITRYKSRDGHSVINDDNSHWLRPAVNQMHRVLKDGGFCVSFYGWNKIDLFFEAWKEAGALDATQRATKVWKKALDEYEEPVMLPDRREALEAYVARRKEAIGSGEP